jgi:hypothetical protein
MTTLTLPDKEQAFAFATMIQAGLPASEAILYFYDSDDPGFLSLAAHKWARCRAVREATLSLMGKAWHKMSTKERMEYALDQHYSQLATLLFSINYQEATPNDKQKMDSARTALEAKVAGTAGKVDTLTAFFEDVKSGRVKLNPIPAKAVAN